MYYPTKVSELSENQMKNLLSGRGVRVKSGNSHILHLSEQQLKKLERASKKGKGLTINFDPFQAMQHKQLKQGGALGKAFKNLGKATKQDFGKLSSSAKKELGKTFNKELGRDVVSGLKVAGLHAIEQGIPAVASLSSMALGDPTGMSGAMLGNIASQYASDAYQKDVMGKGLFKTLHKAGIPLKKKALIRGLKDTASVSASIGSQLAGQAVGMYTGNPMLGQKFAEMSNNVAQSAIQGNLKQGLREAGKMTKNEATRFAVEAVDDVIDRNLTGNEKRLAQNLLANKYGSASDLIYDMSNMYTGTGMKLKRSRGRPKKQGGALYPAGYKGGALGPA